MLGVWGLLRERLGGWEGGDVEESVLGCGGVGVDGWFVWGVRGEG